MALKIGNNAVANAFVGSSQVRRAYKGGTLVYQGWGPSSEREFVQLTAPGGPSELLKVYGKSVIWRQSFKNYSSAYTSNGVTITPDADGYLTFSGTASAEITLYWNGSSGTPPAGGLLTNGHKVFIGLSVAGGSLAGSAVMNITASSGGGSHSIDTAANFIVSVNASGNSYPRILIASATAFSSLKIRIVNIDLTLLYGAGSEPASVAAFLADYPTYDPTYDPGSLQSNKTTELRAYDGGDLRGSLALNLSTLTGKLNGEGASVVVYPDGLRGVGTDRDAAYGSTGVVRFGKRAYQAGDESDTSVLTDGTNTIYPLATPLTYTLDTPLPTDLTCEQGDILQRVSDNNCPFVGEMKFGL